MYLKTLENELIPDGETFSLNLGIPTSQHLTFCKKYSRTPLIRGHRGPRTRSANYPGRDLV